MRSKGLLLKLAVPLVGVFLTAGSPAQADQANVGEFVCRGAEGYAGSFEGRRTFLWRPQWLQAIAADEARRERLIDQAQEALERGPYSVTDKTSLVPGAEPQNYVSLAPYWWPDQGSADGLPYVRRDGEVNPERNGTGFDKERLSNLGEDVEALALGYFLNGDERYASHAAMLVRTWFIDPSTRMSPDMNFAQGIPGRVAGRGEGIIEASDFSTIIESIGLIGPSPALTDDDHQALRLWFGQFANWMATSENGTTEMRKTNNHGVFFDFYLAHFALFAGFDNVTRDIAESFLEYRLARQMDQQGRFIAELRRTRSWHYSNYLVAGAGRLATIAECVDAPIWEARLEDGRGLHLATAFLDRYSGAVETWPFADLDHAAGAFDKMERTHDLIDVLFARGTHFSAQSELP